jgi:hypothetical protein
MPLGVWRGRVIRSTNVLSSQCSIPLRQLPLRLLIAADAEFLRIPEHHAAAAALEEGCSVDAFTSRHDHVPEVDALTDRTHEHPRTVANR